MTPREARTKYYKRRHTWAPVIRYTLDDNIFEVFSPYNELYIIDMKSKVMGRYREWNPDLSVWVYTNKKYLAVIKWLLNNYYNGYVEEWPELSDLDKLVRGMVKSAKTDAKKIWAAKEIVL